ncbi:MAG: DNA polymerase III subunit beta [Candidatus Pacebacteria bacterium CG10_big_fil_rev_8_21_14_0_10_36_11]|nr:DNA polymerase III subunit beta [Candidatus Pacearchaeota archaeon]OIP73888.1 MAG: DNA polymerase III subunit beta [Candidatus Pacebacteria bacterium CG2_30_36_39]PIR64548.1 MAG: DNA polymerase III subunit beta [Candidatus Pacebacteria bacterium CG10_big_fil_rev_8_21_14_0_10_36_11]PJC43252.1 MAG: DNA polymerase III subunit beta [Candidatus Pacebacteria bacterium CG_4_9_14_0_2_um_filter_36_8]
MKFKVLQENLKTALTSLQKAIPSKPQLPILSSVYLQVKGNQLTLAATDLYLGIKSTIPAIVEETGECVVPGEIFKSLIFSFSAGDVEFIQSDTSILVKYEKSKSTLPYQSAEEYPQFPEVNGETFTLSKDLLQKVDTYISFAAAQDQTRPVLTSLLFSFQDKKLEIAATDGYRLAALSYEGEVPNLNKNFLIPVKALNEVFRMMNQVEQEKVAFRVAEELKQVLFMIDGIEIYVRLIEGEYPPYKKIIPEEFAIEIKTDFGEFQTQIKRAFLFAKDSSNIVKLELDKDILRFKANSPATGDYQGEMIVKYSGESQEIAFNAVYLMDFLNKKKEGELIFKMNESLKPAAFQIPDEPNFLYVIMPFRTTSS